MKDQERTGLRRSAAVQIAAALAPSMAPGGEPQLAAFAVRFADLVIAALEAREVEEAKERAALEQQEREAKARAEAARTDVARGAQQVEPH